MKGERSSLKEETISSKQFKQPQLSTQHGKMERHAA